MHGTSVPGGGAVHSIKSGLMQRHKIRAYSIISSARIISDSGMSMPSSTSAGIQAISRPEP
jgi:hypothetical protein